MTTLRDYQRESADALLSYWLNSGGNGLLIAPTGSGKSLILAEIIRRLRQEYGARVVCATHVSELIKQDAAALQALWPEAPVGIYSAGLNKRDGEAPIVFAGIQSVFRHPEVLGPRDVLLIDEAHLLSHRQDGMYHKYIKWLDAQTPGFRVGGTTATPYRLSTGRLDEDYGDKPALFDDVVYDIKLLDLIQPSSPDSARRSGAQGKRGYLCTILPYVSPQRIDTSDVKVSAGEYNLKQLAQTVDRDDINRRVVAEIIRAGGNRKTWLVFASSVEHAKHLCALFRLEDIECAVVLGETSETERSETYALMRSGEMRCLVSMNVATTGLDIPGIDLIGMVRPTKSKGLWVQMLGRGTRIAPDKENCLLLDFTQNSFTHGCLDQIDGSKAPGKGGPAPVKECPECHFVCPAPAHTCSACGYNFPLDLVPKYRPVANTAAVLSTQLEPVWYHVDGIILRRHKKESAPDSLRIDYQCGLLTISHWLALENEKVAPMAQAWWQRNTYSGEPVDSVALALVRSDDLRAPGRIQVVKDGKWSKIVDLDYSIPSTKVIPVRRQLDVSGYRRKLAF